MTLPLLYINIIAYGKHILFTLLTEVMCSSSLSSINL